MGLKKSKYDIGDVIWRWKNNNVEMMRISAILVFVNENDVTKITYYNKNDDAVEEKDCFANRIDCLMSVITLSDVTAMQLRYIEKHTEDLL